MIRKKEDYFKSSNGKNKIHYIIWEGEEKKGILQIVHGMVEYIDRYDDFARFMAENGYVVVGHDHLGHGKSAQSKEDLGFFANENGDMHLLNDIKTLLDITKNNYSILPYNLLGHSMGSFFVRRFLQEFPEENLSSAIIMGTSFIDSNILKTAILILKLMEIGKDKRFHSEKLHSIAMWGYEKRFIDEGKNGWLTKDIIQQEKRANDPLQNFSFSLKAYEDMLSCMSKIMDINSISKIEKNLPILIISGEDDPVGDFGKGPKKLYKLCKKAGLNTKIKIFENDRHEILNESNRKFVYDYMLEFVEKNR